MKKTKTQINAIKDSGTKFPLFWKVVNENGHFIQFRNRLTGEVRVCHK